MKILKGSDLADYIKERQAKAVRSFSQTTHIKPKLAIVLTVDHAAIDMYTKMKRTYGADIGVDVDIHKVKQSEAATLIEQLNQDASVQAIIVQLPLEDPTQTEQLVNQVEPTKDVDGLGDASPFDPATPMAILWLLAGHNIELLGKTVVLIGRGKLVGKPLEMLLKKSGIEPIVVEKETENPRDIILSADVIITATGHPGVLKADMIKQGAVIVDAGTASESGKIVGDAAEDVFEREDLSITPRRGGVGPLTVCALFENVIQAARKSAS